MNWNNVSLVVLGLTAFFSAFGVALWVSLVIWTFRDMRARARDAFAQLLAALMVLILGPLGVVLYLILRPRETLAEKYERSLEEEALLQDIEERQICPGCKQPIEPDFVLCPVCHTRLRRPCVHCGRLINPRWNVCPYCAESQRPVPGAESAGRVTLLDLESEELPTAQEIAPEEAADSISVLEREALRNLSRSEYAEPLVPTWEPSDLEIEEDKVDRLRELFPDSVRESEEGSGELAQGQTEDELGLETESVDPNAAADDPSHQSFFDRG